MVHYIRFLSTPQVSVAQKKVVNVNAPLAVTTDLGDAFFRYDVKLIYSLIDIETQDLLAEQIIVWKASSRALKTSMTCNGKYLGRKVRAHITTAETRIILASKKIPRILDVWSSPFELADKTRSEPLVARELALSNGSRLQLWEETGDSIARHVWDAGMGFLTYFDLALQPQPSEGVRQLTRLIGTSTSPRLQVLELGTGCGTAGIALSQLIPCDVSLTDLEDAMAILGFNIKSASTTSRSTLQKATLDWGTRLDDSFDAKYDMILVSDCIYNPDSSVHLVETLLQLTDRSPAALILVGFKRRHSGDDVFFEQMSKAQFDVVETYNVDLPHLPSDADAYAPIIEFHVFRGPR